MSINRTKDKHMVKATMGYYTAVKKKGLVKLTTAWMHLTDVMLSEGSWTQRKQTLWFHLHEVQKQSSLVTLGVRSQQ